MKLTLRWGKRVPLRWDDDDNSYSIDYKALPEAPGIYIFGRRHGKGFEALYVGKAESNVRSRIKGQMNNHDLMRHIEDAANGARFVLAAEFVTKNGNRPTKNKVTSAVPLIEKAFIRHFLSEGHDLVNKQGTRIKRHEISSDGQHPKKYFPRLIFLESK